MTEDPGDLNVYRGRGLHCKTVINAVGGVAWRRVVRMPCPYCGEPGWWVYATVESIRRKWQGHPSMVDLWLAFSMEHRRRCAYPRLGKQLDMLRLALQLIWASMEDDHGAGTLQ